MKFATRMPLCVCVIAIHAVWGEARLHAELATPELVYEGTEPVRGNSEGLVRHLFRVKNLRDFPDELFEPAPDLPPCGKNTNASRTWVNLHNAADGRVLYGFCGLKVAKDLDGIWFAAREPVPESVFITLEDRREQEKVNSNAVPLGRSKKAVPQALKPGAEPALRQWTNVNQVVIEATLLRVENQVVVLLGSDGKTYRYPIGALSLDDQLYVRDQLAPAPAASPK